MDSIKCSKCNKDISADAKFCGFCGAHLPTVRVAKLPSRSFKQISFAVLFLLYLSLSYFTSLSSIISSFHERSQELKIVVTEFQTNFISSLVFINDFICSMFFVGLFAYWFKGLRTWKYLLSGLVMKYWILLFVAVFYIFRGQTGYS